LGGFKEIFWNQPNTKAAVLIFGCFTVFGLASKLQDFKFGKRIVYNLLGFNIGVEFIALNFCTNPHWLFGAGIQVYEIFNSNKYVAYGCWICLTHQLMRLFYILKKNIM
jgi:hypothetical protein